MLFLKKFLFISFTFLSICLFTWHFFLARMDCPSFICPFFAFEVSFSFSFLVSFFHSFQEVLPGTMPSYLLQPWNQWWSEQQHHKSRSRQSPSCFIRSTWTRISIIFFDYTRFPLIISIPISNCGADYWSYFRKTTWEKTWRWLGLFPTTYLFDNLIELSKLEIVQLTTLVIYAFISMRRYGETNLPTRISDVSDKFKFKFKIIDRSTLWHQVQPPPKWTHFI